MSRSRKVWPEGLVARMPAPVASESIEIELIPCLRGETWGTQDFLSLTQNFFIPPFGRHGDCAKDGAPSFLWVCRNSRSLHFGRVSAATEDDNFFLTQLTARFAREKATSAPEGAGWIGLVSPD